MSVSVYPMLNKEVPGFDVTETSGKALAVAIYDKGSAFAVLQQFSSQSEDDLRGFIADMTGQDPETIQVPAEEWFAPEEGLAAIRSLMEQPSGEPGELAVALASDLQAIEAALLLAQEHGAMFHLTMDF